MFDQVLAQLAVVATFVTTIVEAAKPLYQHLSFQAKVDKVLSIVVSVELCLLWDVDALAAVDIFVGNGGLGAVMTGLAAALGSSALNDFLKLLELWKKSSKPKG